MLTAEELREAFRATADDEAYLTALEANAVAYVQRRLGWYIGASEAVTEYLDGSGTERLWLSDTPSTGPTEAVQRTSPGASDSSTITASATDGFLVRGRKLVRKNGLAWVRGYEYQLAYTRGYASGAEPDDVRMMVQTLTGHWFERRIPVPKIGEVHTFPVPHHLDSLIQAARRQRA